jgi:hypothetical protein
MEEYKNFTDFLGTIQKEMEEMLEVSNKFFEKLSVEVVENDDQMVEVIVGAREELFAFEAVVKKSFVYEALHGSPESDVFVTEFSTSFPDPKIRLSKIVMYSVSKISEAVDISPILLHSGYVTMIPIIANFYRIYESSESLKTA